jgi:hypothetical protein
MLDYAAHARESFSAERMADWLEESAERRGSTAANTLLDAFEIDDVDSYWQTVDTNLKAERFRLVFVSDSIGTELRSIIEFLNRQMSATEVLAIEVKQDTDAQGAHQTIVPSVVGDTAQARAMKRPAARGERLDRETLVARMRDKNEPAAEAAARVLDWADIEPRLDTRYTRSAAVIEVAGQLKGSKFGDVIAALKGRDKITGGKGRDRICASSGRDKVKAADSKRDQVNCGKSKDKATVDEKDKVAGNCETVKVK